MPKLATLFLRIAILVLFAGFGAWTCRRLWRRASSRYEQLVYMYGVKGWGLGFWAITTIIMVSQHTASTLGDVAFRTIAMMVINLPVSLWGGYILGRAMAWIFGVSTPE